MQKKFLKIQLVVEKKSKMTNPRINRRMRNTFIFMLTVPFLEKNVFVFVLLNFQ